MCRKIISNHETFTFGTKSGDKTNFTNFDRKRDQGKFLVSRDWSKSNKTYLKHQYKYDKKSIQ